MEVGFGEMFGGGLCEGLDSVVDANETAAGEMDAEGDAEKCVGERSALRSHCSLRRAGRQTSYIFRKE